MQILITLYWCPAHRKAARLTLVTPATSYRRVNAAYPTHLPPPPGECRRVSLIYSHERSAHLRACLTPTFLDRATLRRGFAFSASINNKNPPLIKSRNVTSLSLAHQQSMATAAAAGSAGAQPSSSNPFQFVYDPKQSGSDTTGRPETNHSDT